jgi:hypothetical protein
MSNYTIIDTAVNTTPYIQDLKNDGIKTVIRYYANQGSWKLFTPAEAAALANGGFQLMVVFEYKADSSYFNETQGQKDGERVLVCANDIGQPAESAIYFAVDYDATESDLNNLIIPYFRGVQQAFAAAGNPYKIGAYGSGFTINGLKNNGNCEYRWLAESTGWAGFQESIKNGTYELRQIEATTIDTSSGPISIDSNEMNPSVSDFGAFYLRPKTA